MTKESDEILSKEQWIDKNPNVIAICKKRDDYVKKTRDLENTVSQGLYKIKTLMVGVDVLQDKVWDLEGTFPKKQEKLLRTATTEESESWFFTHRQNVDTMKGLAIDKAREIVKAQDELNRLEAAPPWKEYWEVREEAGKEYDLEQAAIKEGALSDDYMLNNNDDAYEKHDHLVKEEEEDLCDERGRPL